MPDKQETLQRILDTGIAAVIRAKSSAHLIDVAEAIKAGGVECIEVTMTTPDALKVIEEASKRFGEEVVIGVGSTRPISTRRKSLFILSFPPGQSPGGMVLSLIPTPQSSLGMST